MVDQSHLGLIEPAGRRQSEPLPPATAAVDYDWNQFYGDLGASITAQLAGTYPTPVTLVQRPAQGDFLWYFEANGLFNQGTFDYISASVAPSPEYPAVASLSVSGGFVNAYVQVLAKIVYTVSSAQHAEILRVTQSASAQALTIVSDYQALFGPITPAQIEQARTVCGAVVQTPLDYVISYILGATWSGRAAVRALLLTYQDMQKTTSVDALVALLPSMPPSGTRVVADVWSYLQATASVAAVQSQAQLGSWTVAQLLANTSDPGDINGGMRTVDPLTGTPLPNDQVRYQITRSIAQIQRDLSDAGRVLTASSILEPSDGSAPIKVTMQYPGYTLVPIVAFPWSAGNTGWFLPGPIASAYANQDKNVTGYHFIADPGPLQTFAFGGTFGMLTNLVISNFPTSTFEELPGTASGLAAARTELGSRILPLLAPLGLDGERVRYSIRTGRHPATGHALTICSPQAAVALSREVPTPILMQNAYVVGCTIGNPAVNG